MKPPVAHVQVHGELIHQSRWRARAVLLLGTSIFFIFGYDMLSLQAVAPSLLSHSTWQVTPGTLGMLASATALGGAIGAFMASGLIETYGRRSVIAVCVGWVSGCMLFAGLTPNLLAFAFSRFLLGVGLGILAPLICVLVVDWARLGRRSLYCGIAQSGLPLGGVAAASANHTFLAGMEFQWTFLVGALPILLVPVCWNLIPTEEPSEAFLPDRATRRDARVVTGEWWGLFEPGWPAASILFSVTCFIGLLLAHGVTSMLPTLRAGAGYDPSHTLEFVIAFNGGAVVISLLISMIADWVPAKLCVAALFLCASAAMRALPTVEGHLAILGMVALAGGGILGSQNVICAYAARYYPHQLRRTALGFVLGVGRFGSVIGPSYITFLIGVSSDPAAAFYSLVIPALIGAVAIILVPHGRRSERPSMA
ncbi:aromatic acid/H+ symport family MFS transporter [Streptomyces luteolifulvus]|uniref:Aromatic acid/H+ symport family MFS transporter n=1 Tax=Streptomyces luteolifulvus TaxID=2615112 RepID=A0A6H9UPS6_9ACTN|nr:MFS transporter [Streptomyces luteolifulvus]KAB1139651.1 aromatic acid/H+ symport family MFS transporter [Streptomyces luteolifulvus]